MNQVNTAPQRGAKGKINPRLVTIVSKEQRSPNMQRLTLSGDALEDFPDIKPGAYIKFMFNHYGEPLTAKPDDDNPILLRTYTVREYTKATRTLVVDMVLHGEGAEAGPASHWAQTAKPGDSILLGGPGGSKPLTSEYDWVLFAGDMTSTPAIASYLETLPAHTQGHVVLSVLTADDAIEYTKPEGVKIHYAIEDEGQNLVDVVKAVPWQQGTPGVWAACEFSSMRALRTYFTQERDVARDKLYISSYWREGRSEDQHKIDKRKDMEAFEGS